MLHFDPQHQESGLSFPSLSIVATDLRFIFWNEISSLSTVVLFGKRPPILVQRERLRTTTEWYVLLG